MKWTVPFPLFPAEHLLPMARAAEAAGFDTIAVPDSVFFPEEVSADYPYTPDGGRFWAPDTPFVDPFVGHRIGLRGRHRPGVSRHRLRPACAGRRGPPSRAG